MSPTQTSPTNGAIFVIDDGSQPKIELSSRDRNLIAATFTHFLIKNIGGSETFKDKQDFFYHEVRKFHSNYYHEKLSLKVQREKILESSMKATKNFSGKDYEILTSTPSSLMNHCSLRQLQFQTGAETSKSYFRASKVSTNAFQ